VKDTYGNQYSPLPPGSGDALRVGEMARGARVEGTLVFLIPEEVFDLILAFTPADAGAILVSIG
jgi:hypothetical protein